MKLRVLEVLASLRRAGAERMAVSLARSLDPARFETAFAVLYGPAPDDFEPELATAGTRVWRLGKHRGLDLRMVPRLYRVLREFQPDIVHTHSYVLRYTLPAGIAAGVRGMVHTVHNLAGREVDFTGRLIQRYAFRRRVAPVAVAAEVAASIRELYGLEPAATIPNGIALENYCSAAGAAWRAANGFGADDLLVLSVARLDPQKNPLGLVEAFGKALGGNPRAHLLLAGGGSLLDAMRRDLPARVHLLGVRTDVPALLAAADIFALASQWEGHPIAVMEAMAAGLPVAATAVGGVPGLVEHDATGLLAGGMEALAAALATLAGDAELRRRMGSAARERSAGFGVAAMASAYARLFEQVAERTR